MVNGTVAYSSDLTDGETVPTVQGGEVTIRIDNGTVFVNNAEVIIPDVLIAGPAFASEAGFAAHQSFADSYIAERQSNPAFPLDYYSFHNYNTTDDTVKLIKNVLRISCQNSGLSKNWTKYLKPTQSPPVRPAWKSNSRKASWMPYMGT